MGEPQTGTLHTRTNIMRTGAVRLGLAPGGAGLTNCAICQHLALPQREVAGTVGLLTREPGIVAQAIDRFGASGGDEHVLVAACPEHVVDVYRERIPGVKMAWRLGEEPATPRSPAAASASPA